MGLPGSCTFNRTRLVLRMVVIPVIVIGGRLATGFSSTLDMGGGGLRPKTFRSTIPWYGLAESFTIAGAPAHNTMLLKPITAFLKLSDIPVFSITSLGVNTKANLKFCALWRKRKKSVNLCRFDVK